MKNINCTQLQVIADEIRLLNNQLNSLSNLDWDTVQQIIPIDFIKNDIKTQINKHNNSISPVITNKGFIANWQFINMKYHFINESIYFEFSIPLYHSKSMTLFNIHPKPLIRNNEIFLYNTQSKYVILETENKIFFEENAYKNNCIIFTNKYYCTKNTKNISQCDNYYINLNTEEFRTECFTQLHSENMITQIGRKLFFTTINKMDILINQYGLEYSITIKEPSKIMDSIDYNLYTNYFNFSQNNGNIYKIFSSNSLDNAIYYKFNINSESNKLIIICTIQLLIIIFTIKGIKYFFTRKNTNRKIFSTLV